MKEYEIIHKVEIGQKGFNQVEYDLFTVVSPDGEEIESFGGAYVNSNDAKRSAQNCLNSYNVELFRKRIAELERENAQMKEALNKIFEPDSVEIWLDNPPSELTPKPPAPMSRFSIGDKVTTDYERVGTVTEFDYSFEKLRIAVRWDADGYEVLYKESELEHYTEESGGAS